MARKSNRGLEARKAIEFLQSSKLIDLKQPLDQVVGAVSRLDEVAGYVIAWERYVLVVAELVDERVITERDQLG